MPWLLFSYLAARGDDEAPLAIPSHVAVMCGLTFTRILFPPAPVPCVFRRTHVTGPQTGPQTCRRSWSSAEALLANLVKWPSAAALADACVDQFFPQRSPLRGINGPAGCLEVGGFGGEL